MSILAMLGFDHLPKGVYSKAPDRFNGMSYLDAGWAYGSYNTNKSMQIDEQGWLKSYPTPTADGAYVGFSFGVGNANNPWGLTSTSTKLRFGFRLQMLSAYVATAATTNALIMCGANDSNWNANLQNGVAGLVQMYLYEIPGIANAKVGDEFYIEWEMPRADGSSGYPAGKIYVDGQYVKDTPSGNSQLNLRPSATTATVAILLSRLAAHTNYRIRDLVITDNVDRGDGVTELLGPVSLRPLTVKEVSAPDWVVPDGMTAKEVLDRGLGVGGETVLEKYIRSPVTNSNVDLILDAPEGMLGNILGVASYVSYLKESGGQPTALFAKTMVGDSESAESELGGAVGSVRAGRRAFLQQRAPDGGKWTVDKIKQLKLRLRAQVEA